MSHDNSLRGEERIANKLLLKLAIRLESRRARCESTCEGNQASDLAAISAGAPFCAITRAAIVACDFCVAVTASFRVLYIFVIIEHTSRRPLHCNVTSNPTAAWTLQQLREAIASDHPYRFLVHDRDSI
jgi:putative transposase